MRKNVLIAESVRRNVLGRVLQVKFVFVGMKISRQQEVFLTEERPYPHLLLHRSAGPALPQPVDNL